MGIKGRTSEDVRTSKKDEVWFFCCLQCYQPRSRKLELPLSVVGNHIFTKNVGLGQKKLLYLCWLLKRSMSIWCFCVNLFWQIGADMWNIVWTSFVLKNSFKFYVKSNKGHTGFWKQCEHQKQKSLNGIVTVNQFYHVIVNIQIKILPFSQFSIRTGWDKNI